MIHMGSIRLNAERLASAQEQARSLAHATRDAFGKAETFQDPYLSSNGLGEKRAELKRAFAAASLTDLDIIRERVASARAYLAEQAHEHTRIPLDTASLMQAKMRWEQVQMRLDAGHDFRDVLATADEATALAIAEYAPSWVKTHTKIPDSLFDIVERLTTNTEPTTDHAVTTVLTLVHDRLSKVAADPNLRELLAAEVAADTQVAVTQPWIDVCGNLIHGNHGDMLNAAIASQLAAQTSLVAPATADA